MGAPLAYRTRLQSCGGARAGASQALIKPLGRPAAGRVHHHDRPLSKHELHEGASMHAHRQCRNLVPYIAACYSKWIVWQYCGCSWFERRAGFLSGNALTGCMLSEMVPEALVALS